MYMVPDIRSGDLLVTSGLGGAFPAGYPVAVVDTVNRIPQEPFADVSATPAAAKEREVVQGITTEKIVRGEPYDLAGKRIVFLNWHYVHPGNDAT